MHAPLDFWPDRDYIISTMRTIPDFDTVYRDIGEFLIVAVEGLEAGTAHAREYYERRKRDIEPPLASTMTRSIAKEHISEKCGLSVEEFKQKEIANIGLRAVVRNYRVWIWKSPNDGIPYPGRSSLKRNFLDQAQLSFTTPGFSLPVVNLVLLWNATAKYLLTETYLALPKSAPDHFFGPTDVYWCRAIPHPETTVRPAETVRTESDEDTVTYERSEEEEAGRESQQER